MSVRDSTTKGSPDNTVILHWDECQTSWAELSWRDWVRFRAVGDGGLGELAGAEAGEHYFLVCILGDRGELWNVIPHRYVMSADGRLVHGFDGLDDTERTDRRRRCQCQCDEPARRHALPVQVGAQRPHASSVEADRDHAGVRRQQHPRDPHWGGACRCGGHRAARIVAAASARSPSARRRWVLDVCIV